MTNSKKSDVIVVRSLTDSDLGLFAAHRPTTLSKQRALNINSSVAQILFSPQIIADGEALLDCKIILQELSHSSKRHFGKVGKNWRLGGKKIEGDEFAQLDSRDFALIRSSEFNDGSQPITILFISRILDSFQHARISRLVEPTIRDSMEIYREGSAGYLQLAMLMPAVISGVKNGGAYPINSKVTVAQDMIPPIPRIEDIEKRNRTVKEKIHSGHILEQMFKASGDLSAPAQLSFIEDVEILASQLRSVLVASKRIVSLHKDHANAWKAVKGKQIAFVDGGLANLSMLGSTPIAARVGGYVVNPGDYTPQREKFIVLKKLINELYSSIEGGVYNGSFPDSSALRDAARISIEAAGAVHLLNDDPSIDFLFLHGALVNPISRYSDIMRDGTPRFHFPNFSPSALKELLPGIDVMGGRDSNFISVYLHQLKKLQSSKASVCGVIEREATTSSVIRSVLNSLEDQIIAPHLSMPSAEWKRWFRNIVDPAEEDDSLGQRITDSLLFRCVLEPGEALVPVEIDRNEMRRAPNAWQDVISNYPKPLVSYLQPSEWSAPIRLEIFNKDLETFPKTAELIFHSSLLLPRYAFPAGLDIVDKFAHIPNWMSKPINTNTSVQALKKALYKGDEKLFDALRRMLCGSNREWLLRPGVNK